MALVTEMSELKEEMNKVIDWKNNGGEIERV